MTAIDAREIRAAAERIRAHLPETPLIRAWTLEAVTGRPTYLKCELLNVTGSFKPRGVLNWLLCAEPAELEPGLATISAGNHALALAWAAGARGVHVKVVMPAASSPMKVAATRALGAEVVLHGDINEAMARLDEILASEGRTLVHPFDDARIIAGQGSVGLEIAAALPDVSQVLCPVGGGGLVSGLAIAIKHLSPTVKVIGLEPAGAPTLRSAWDNGGPIRLDHVDTVAASLGASLTGRLTYAISREVVDDIRLLSEDDIVLGFRETLLGCKLLAEPGGALGVAAALRGLSEPGDGPIVIVVTGGNMDAELLTSLLQADSGGAHPPV